MKKTNFILSLALMFALVTASLQFPSSEASAAKKPKLNKTNISLTVGNTYKLKVKNNKKKVTWKSSNKKIATVSSKGTVRAKKAGTAKITAKVKNKKLICKVTIKSVSKNATANNVPAKNTPTPITAENSIDIIFPDIDDPVSFHDGSQEYTLSRIKAEWKYDKVFNNNSLKLYFDGAKIGDTFSETHNFPITIHYKLYNANGAVAESGFAMTPSICVGDRFENVDCIVSLNLPNGIYRLEIENS